MMARCTVPARRPQFIEVLFKNQDSWAKAQDPKSALARIGKLGGMSQEQFDRCTSDQALFEGMQKLQLEAQQKYDVNATPTFIVTSGKSSDGEKISGSQPYEVFEKAFAKALQ
jgi:protein-disulfide isomerase